jgi:hypothetical protein
MFATYTADKGFEIRALIGLVLVALVVIPCGFIFTEWLARHNWGPYKKIKRRD